MTARALIRQLRANPLLQALEAREKRLSADDDDVAANDGAAAGSAAAATPRDGRAANSGEAEIEVSWQMKQVHVLLNGQSSLGITVHKVGMQPLSSMIAIYIIYIDSNILYIL